MSAWSCRCGPWRLSDDGSQFETGQLSTGMVALAAEQAVTLLVTREPALQDFLRLLSMVMHNRFGDNSFLEQAVAEYKHAHPPVPAPKVPDHRTPQPRDKDDGY